ncbi:MAG: molybdopterin molybdotransferase MoeA [Ignavibacteriae bacterium]|nr:molybdopterin molybdotransferase MoeA [Ignavibacteria bacterium]MBI3363463.1 molybdopterin molybdotransferase MoeA [Ignavibacteriota bacterium]
MLNAEEALSIIRESVKPLGTITVALQRSLGYVLAGDILARGNVPSFDNSAMDGFALKAEDVQLVPATLTLIGEVAAGAIADRPVRAGETMRIMTGAKIPDECTAVVQQEWTEMVDELRVRVTQTVKQGHNIRKAGADIQSGMRVLECGRVIRPQEIGVLASLGIRFVNVYRKPSAAILATGNEVVDIRNRLTEGKVRNSNIHTLAALVEQHDCEAVMLGIAHDNPEELREKFLAGLASDILITTGGVSVGKYDLVIDALKDIGVEIKFWKVNIKPGMPLVFGMYREKPIFGLPGNPVSSMVTFLEFVLPALTIMKGERAISSRVTLTAALVEEITKTDGKRHFIRGVLENRNGSLVVRTTGSQISNILTSLIKANCLIILPEAQKHFAAGEQVEVELL